MPIPLLGRLRSALAEAREQRAARRAAATLRRTLAGMPDELDADAVVDFLFSDQAGPIQPWQFDQEFRPLARLVQHLRPRCVLEIGTADGGTLFAHTRLASPDAIIVSLDLPHGPFGGGYAPWRIPLYESFARPGQRLELLRADSHADATATELERLLGGRRVDYAFIDGDHTYDGVRQDFELCRRFAADDAVIAFHDIVEHRRESNCDVHRLWLEIRENFAHDELVGDWAQGFYGIGVVFLGARPDTMPAG